MIGQRLSMRRRLVVSVAIAMVAIMAMLALAVHTAISEKADEVFVERLTTSAKVLEGLISKTLNELPPGAQALVELNDADLATLGKEAARDSGHKRKIAFQVWSDMGVLLAKSTSAPMQPMGSFEQGQQQIQLGAQEWQVFALKAGDIWVMAAQDSQSNLEATTGLMYAVFVPFLVGGVSLLFLVNFVLLRGLKPLNDLASEIQSRDGELTDPVRGRWPSELQLVVDAFNGMLSRVNLAMRQEKLFLDSAAHEIRTPVAAIQLHVQNALHTDDQTQQRASLELANRGVRRASHLISQMMELSRVHADDEGRAEQSYLALDEVCRAAALAMAPVVSAKSQTIDINLQSDVVIKASLLDVESIVGNLLDNASKYGDAESVITLAVIEQDDVVELCVTNAGPLIDEDKKATIFRPYFRGLDVTQFGVPGSGLGLTIVKQCAERNGASVQVEDAIGQSGSTFRVTFSSAMRHT